MSHKNDYRPDEDNYLKVEYLELLYVSIFTLLLSFQECECADSFNGQCLSSKKQKPDCIKFLFYKIEFKMFFSYSSGSTCELLNGKLIQSKTSSYVSELIDR